MLSITHVINPVVVSESSDLYRAQPVTFASMLEARKYSETEVDVEICAATFPEDSEIVPESFKTLDPIDRSVLDCGHFSVRKKLPLLLDILMSAYRCSESDYLIYTNVDIGLQPYFYSFLARKINEPNMALIINRRTITAEIGKPFELAEIYSEVGEKHRGFDCFIFPRKIVPDLILGDICIGMQGVGLALALNLRSLCQPFELFKDVHLTFHLGNDKSWRSDIYDDLRSHNISELDKIIDELEVTHGEFKQDCPEYEYVSSRKNERRNA